MPCRPHRRPARVPSACRVPRPTRPGLAPCLPQRRRWRTRTLRGSASPAASPARSPSASWPLSLSGASWWWRRCGAWGRGAGEWERCMSGSQGRRMGALRAFARLFWVCAGPAERGVWLVARHHVALPPSPLPGCPAAPCSPGAGADLPRDSGVPPPDAGRLPGGRPPPAQLCLPLGRGQLQAPVCAPGGRRPRPGQPQPGPGGAGRGDARMRSTERQLPGAASEARAWPSWSINLPCLLLACSC